MQRKEVFSKHAMQRSQQRAIPPFIAELILDYGKSTRKHGADVYFLDNQGRKRIEHALGRKIYTRVMDQLDIYVVCEGQVITIGHRTKRIKV